VKAITITEPTHNPFDKTHRVSCLRENFTSSSYGEGLETDRTAPRQSFTRQTFHKILKSGWRAEQSKLRTAERLVNLLAMFCILSWRIFWLTMINRVAENSAPETAFTPLEIDLLNRLTQRRSKVRAATLHDCLTQLAKLGGYLARAGDGPPGNMVMWRGMTRLTDIELGFQLGSQDVGN
jgi:hypothetical protein